MYVYMYVLLAIVICITKDITKGTKLNKINCRNNRPTEQIQKVFQVTRQSYFDINDILFCTCCHFPPILKFLNPNESTRGSVNMTCGSSFPSMPLARKFLLATCSERADTVIRPSAP